MLGTQTDKMSIIWRILGNFIDSHSPIATDLCPAPDFVKWRLLRLMFTMIWDSEFGSSVAYINQIAPN